MSLEDNKKYVQQQQQQQQQQKVHIVNQCSTKQQNAKQDIRHRIAGSRSIQTKNTGHKTKKFKNHF